VKRVVIVLILAACRSKAAPQTTATTASASASVSSARTAIVDASADVERRAVGFRWDVVDVVGVSSRVDNGTESPESLLDGDTSTAWSSRTGDLVGAWVALRLNEHADVASLALTVGMTKSDELFHQNVRISEVQIAFKDVVLVDHFKLDTESRELQVVPVSAIGKGDLKITVQAIAPGTKPSWREATISEIELRDAAGKKLRAAGIRTAVGSLDPKPRGVLGIVPEDKVPLRCLAAMPSVPRVYCATGQSGNHTKSASLVSIDKGGMTVILPLMTETTFDVRFTYADWLRVEHDVRAASTLDPKAGTSIPWNGAVEIEGATFRQRATSDAGDDSFPGVATFTEIFGEITPTPTGQTSASVERLGAMWLVQRSGSHGSEGWFLEQADASLCDLRAHVCTKTADLPQVGPTN
jgi:hypothetical protein